MNPWWRTEALYPYRLAPDNLAHAVCNARSAAPRAAQCNSVREPAPLSAMRRAKKALTKRPAAESAKRSSRPCPPVPSVAIARGRAGAMAPPSAVATA